VLLQNSLSTGLLRRESEVGFETGAISKSDSYAALNASQQSAVDSACRQRVTLIQGPPGTGKTKTLAMIAALMHRQSSLPVLVCAN